VPDVPEGPDVPEVPEVGAGLVDPVGLLPVTSIE
jgi:hypothetical protein